MIIKETIDHPSCNANPNTEYVYFVAENDRDVFVLGQMSVILGEHGVTWNWGVNGITALPVKVRNLVEKIIERKSVVEED